MSANFICCGKPSYDWEKKLKGLTPDAYSSFRRRVLSMSLPADASEIKNTYIHDGLIMEGDEVDAWAGVGVEVTVSRPKGLRSSSEDLHKTVYQIAVANVGLMQIQRVEVIDGADWRDEWQVNELQRWLDRGWRLLAVCPPNDDKMPRYVVGHFDKEAQ